MQHIYREMYSPGEALVEDHIEKEENRLYKGQKIKTLEKKHKTIEKDRG